MNESEWDNFSISARNFYSEEGDNTKENWFLYELSNVIYDGLTNEITISGKYTEEELLELTLNLSRCGQEAVRNSLRKGKYVRITKKDFQERFAPDLQSPHEKKMLKVAAKGVNMLVSTCLHCPTRCIYDWDGKCDMFDAGPI